ncbi:protein-L-histidine N-pros-methyltransferase [Ixodes scapularis]|uniref:protein-L-histidine N-pros-methyltransferase n=1 Tax=Ixodes scapularis TaxID=6945 RepID=UPI001C37F23E|nr:protein-L-histidine N-pros-methyltransferase [Ixodes scapularis]
MAQLRPVLRSPMARTLYERLLRDRELQHFDKSQWYHVDLSRIENEDVRSRFVQCELDGDTQAFLDRSTEKSGWLGTQILHAVVRLFLGWFITKTSLNGFLGRGSMFVFSRAQFLGLLGFSEDASGPIFSSLLDIGAGDGNVTAVLAPYFRRVDVTEVSPPMRRILQRRGYRVLDAVSLTSESNCTSSAPAGYDVVCCLNVLDRCDAPLALLRSLRSKLATPSGKLVVAVVVPLSQYVESGQSGTVPAETLGVSGTTLEEQVESLCRDVMEPAGFALESWTRLPYLCEGDLEQAYYWLDDVVMVLRAAGDTPSS